MLTAVGFECYQLRKSKKIKVSYSTFLVMLRSYKERLRFAKMADMMLNAREIALLQPPGD